MYGRSGLDDFFHKRNDLMLGCVSDATQANASKSFGLQHLHCNDHKRFGRLAVVVKLFVAKRDQLKGVFWALVRAPVCLG